jgi:hypothetical protein
MPLGMHSRFLKQERTSASIAEQHGLGVHALVHSNRGGANICKVNAEAVTRSIGYHPRMRGICLEGLTLTGG